MTASLPETRVALHAVAEHVLAGARFRADGRIGLVATPGGFATPAFGPDATVLAVDGASLVLTRAGAATRHPLTTLRELAAVAGGPPGAPNSYPTSTHLDPDAPLAVDPVLARRLCDWLLLGNKALREFAAALGAEVSPTLWPEHFDVGIRVGGVNYGCSPGDEHVELPYLYVGPDAHPDDPFWNVAFGAARTWSQVGDVDAAVAFFHEGARRAGAPG